MKTLVISFTDAFKSFVEGKLSADLLRDSLVAFGCRREHLFTEDKVPCEVTWASLKVKHLYQGEITVEQICDERTQTLFGRERYGLTPDELVEKWVEFFLIIKGKDKRDEIYWVCGNYPGLMDEALRRGVPVFYQGSLHRPEDFDHQSYNEFAKCRPQSVVRDGERVLAKLYPELNIEVEE